MQITFLTKTGHIALLKKVKNHAGVTPGDVCAVEIEHCSSIEGGYENVIRDFLNANSMQGTCVLCLDDFSAKLKGEFLPAPLLQKGRGAAYITSVSIDGLMELFIKLKAYKYGEFCFLLSKISREEVENELLQMQRLDILSLISRKELELKWLVGLDIESDTGTIASKSKRDIFSFIADKYI